MAKQGILNYNKYVYIYGFQEYSRPFDRVSRS